MRQSPPGLVVVRGTDSSNTYFGWTPAPMLPPWNLLNVIGTARGSGLSLLAINSIEYTLFNNGAANPLSLGLMINSGGGTLYGPMNAPGCGSAFNYCVLFAQVQ